MNSLKMQLIYAITQCAVFNLKKCSDDTSPFTVSCLHAVKYLLHFLLIGQFPGLNSSHLGAKLCLAQHSFQSRLIL